MVFQIYQNETTIYKTVNSETMDNDRVLNYRLKVCHMLNLRAFHGCNENQLVQSQNPQRE